MSSETPWYELEEEEDKELKNIATKYNACLLCLIAPFVPERVAPGVALYAELRFPEEFLIEKFITIVDERYPNKDSRPQLYLLIHSPGGLVNSAYIIARALRSRFNNIVAFIPHIAASGATLVAISANEIVMGDISRLSPIDPYYREDDKIMYPKAIIGALSALEGYFSKTSEEEAPYPYKILAERLDPEVIDRAIRMLDLVRNYALELLTSAGYSEDEAKRIVTGLIDETTIHEEALTLEKLRAMGLKVYYYREREEYMEVWKAMKRWLEKYYFKPSKTHIIKYVLAENRGGERGGESS